MANWKNLDQLQAFEELKAAKKVNIREAMTGESGADRVRSFSVSIAEGLDFNYAARPVDADLLAVLAKLAEEAELSEKYKELYEGAVINTGEKRLVLHQLCRGQLGKDVIADGVNKREFYVKQQERIAEFAKKVHAGEITNAAGEKFTTVVQIGIGGSDLGPRAIYIALENWARRYGKLKMEAKFISNVDPDDASAVLASVDVAHTLFVLVSKSGTTLETLTNESFVTDALKKAGLSQSNHMIAVTSETSPLAKNENYLAAFFMDDYIGGRYSSSSAVGGAVLSLAFGPEVFADFLDGAAAADRAALETDPLKNAAMLEETDRSYAEFCADRKKLLRAILLEYLARILEGAEYYLIFLYLGVNVHLTGGILILTFASLIGNLLFMVPMQAGTREGGMAIALDILGISSGLGVMGGLVYRIRDLICTIIGIIIILAGGKKRARTP